MPLLCHSHKKYGDKARTCEGYWCAFPRLSSVPFPADTRRVPNPKTNRIWTRLPHNCSQEKLVSTRNAATQTWTTTPKSSLNMISSRKRTIQPTTTDASSDTNEIQYVTGGASNDSYAQRFQNSKFLFREARASLYQGPLPEGAIRRLAPLNNDDCQCVTNVSEYLTGIPMAPFQERYAPPPRSLLPKKTNHLQWTAADEVLYGTLKSSDERKTESKSSSHNCVVTTRHIGDANNTSLEGLPIVELDTHVGPAKFLVDSGACKSFITTGFYELVQENLQLLELEEDREYVTANGDAIIARGKVFLTIVLHNDAYAAEFIVADVSTNIIGYDVLEQHDLLLFHHPPRL